MSGSLVLIDSDTASSSSSISLTGMTSEYNVYIAQISAVTHSATSYDYIRFTTSGSPDTSSNYDASMRVVRSDNTFFSGTYSNDSFIYLSPYTKSTTAQDQTNAIIYIFNAGNSSEYTSATFEEASQGTNLVGSKGAMTLTVAQATDGINFSPSTGNYSSGEFKLYALKK